ncbi:hypothetical protein QC763_112760 [Podospora pseudopauciseta]|uniref:F-box domain-containing protein n=2 Tax=Podospora TaxID=5144 RepID=A0ABR0I091_9PEZI|nr:hypothetical protein QC763_112760 [Podospora pseudopauciseta]KAK4682023.1 hypothetical protein QC764_112760 [Podospora pseudoanserina]
MDPLHITEFGSERYLEKVQQFQAQTEANASQGQGAVSTLLQSPFILPIRESGATGSDVGAKSNEQKRPEKKGFSSWRNRFTKPPAVPPSSICEQPERRPSLPESTTKQPLPFDHLFAALPNELQVEIIASLPLSDVLNLRLASKSLHALVSLNEVPITRYHLDYHIPAYAKRLYPLPQGRSLNFHYLCGIWHRLHVAAKLSHLMCQLIIREQLLLNTEEKRRQYAPQTERMRRRLIPILFTVFHFFETYRKLHLKYMAEHDGFGLSKTPYTVNPIEAEIMNMYDDRTLLRVHEAFPLVIWAFCRRLRPPSYVGRVERSLRGYLKERPPDEVHVAVLCLGGMREVLRLWEVKGYNARRAAVDAWYESILHEQPVEPEPKRRRGMLGLKRKKSSFNMGKTNGHGHEAQHGANDVSAARGKQPDSLVFHTSLAAGMPMAPLSKDESKLLYPDLPVLQRIWLVTAEAMILDRKIVERPAHIHRNAQVFTDLISESGIDEEDQWLYGTTAPESVRPNLDAIEEDPDE